MRKIRVFYQKYSYLYHSLLCPLFHFDIFIFFSYAIPTSTSTTHLKSTYILNHCLWKLLQVQEKNRHSRYTRNLVEFFSFVNFQSISISLEMHFRVDSTQKCEMFDHFLCSFWIYYLVHLHCTLTLILLYLLQ